MSNLIDLNNLFHRSRDRIFELGEVFTPEAYVEGMLDLLGKDKRNFWNNEDISFLEPTCGHGNIVVPLLKRRLESIYKKALAEDISKPEFYSVANSINTLWAIDVDKENIQHCRTRVFSIVVQFLKEKTNLDEFILFKRNQSFFAHLICALRWHIQENECLSSLSQNEAHKISASKTKVGSKWVQSNNQKKIDFDNTWVSYFETQKKQNLTVLDFERASKFIQGLLSGNPRGYIEFEFAKLTFIDSKDAPKASLNKSPVIGI